MWRCYMKPIMQFISRGILDSVRQKCEQYMETINIRKAWLQHIIGRF